ncbi:MAG: hypothetical protein Q8933_07090 [Bacteroidota bacterium]|nr:hypothetical protein [Bacteroidota bacterium]MDP4191734.1 hypothetical protein [Bacteroidota bacterium]MDP4193494.1 hypothetical protein [Bacteroidota bacterium]
MKSSDAAKELRLDKAVNALIIKYLFALSNLDARFTESPIAV